MASRLPDFAGDRNMDRVIKSSRTSQGKGGGGPPGSRGQRGGAGRGGRVEPDVRDEGLRQTLSVLIKQSFKNTQDMRMVKPAVLDCFIGTKVHPVIKAIEKEKQGYIDRQLEGIELPCSPHPYMFFAFLATLAEQNIGQANQKAMRDVITQIEKIEMTELEKQINGVYIEKTYNPDHVKLWLGLGKFNGRDVVVHALKQIEFSHKTSRPPAGWMEETLANALEKLEK